MFKNYSIFVKQSIVTLDVEDLTSWYFQKGLMEYSRSILLIDDDSISNYLVSLLLGAPENSLPFHVAENAEDALKYLRDLNQTARVLILLDIHMPVLNGFEFLGQLDSVTHIDKSLIDIVIISSSIAQKDFDKARSIGIDKFLVKPITKESLQVFIEKFQMLD